MAAYPFRKMNPVIPTTSIVTYNNTDLLLQTATFASQLATPKFIIQLDQTVPYGVTFPTVMGLSGLSEDLIFLYDRLGYYVRADRLYRAMQMRQNGCICYDGCVNEFQCVIRFDPLRVYVLNALPPSVYVPTVTTTTVHTTISPATTGAQNAATVATIG